LIKEGGKEPKNVTYERISKKKIVGLWEEEYKILEKYLRVHNWSNKQTRWDQK